jgi:amphi-Trp domain-containing protein
MAATEEFEYESLQDVESIVAYLHALSDGLKRGHLVLAANGRDLVLEPAGLLRLAVEAKRGKSRSRLVVKIAWRESSHEERTEPLRISPAQP